MSHANRIGFMQGRLSDMQRGRIQSFPWGSWENELELASSIGIDLIEWTIDQHNFDLNPLIHDPQHVANVIKDKKFRVLSVTCDSFMEEPFWKNSKMKSLYEIENIISGMKILQAKVLVVPLVDNSSLSELKNVEDCIDFFRKMEKLLEEAGVKIAFEVDTNPVLTREFIEHFSVNYFGINYDIGNSASLDFNPVKEMAEYGKRIINVHVKDRKIHGNTVPLGEGNAKMEITFQLLNKLGYSGSFILQTARSNEGQHSKVLENYIEYTKQFLLSPAERDIGGV